MLQFALASLLLLAPPEKDLRNEWRAAEGFEPKAGAKPDVRIGHSVIVLRNRGLAVTKEKLSDGSVSLRRTQAFDNAEGTTYHDHLCIVLRTNGARSKEWPFEIDSGIIVRLAADMIGVETKVSGEGTQQLIPVKDLDLSGERQISVEDKDDKIVVSVDGKVVLEGAVDPAFGGENRNAAVYNREGVANALHVAVLSDVETK